MINVGEKIINVGGKVGTRNSDIYKIFKNYLNEEI